MSTLVNDSYITFEDFRSMVNKALNKKAGLCLEEMADFDLWNYFDYDLSLSNSEWKKLASEAVDDMLAEEGILDEF